MSHGLLAPVKVPVQRFETYVIYFQEPIYRLSYDVYHINSTQHNLRKLKGLFLARWIYSMQIATVVLVGS